MSELLQVRAADPRRVALWERDPAHPGGEVYVAGTRVVTVALTRAVERALSKGALVRIERDASPVPPLPDPPEGSGIILYVQWDASGDVLRHDGQVVLFTAEELAEELEHRPATAEEVAGGIALSAVPAADIETLPLPDDLAALLYAAGFGSVSAIQSADDDDLLAINGIGAERLATIREALPHTPADDTPPEDES